MTRFRLKVGGEVVAFAVGDRGFDQIRRYADIYSCPVQIERRLPNGKWRIVADDR